MKYLLIERKKIAFKNWDAIISVDEYLFRLGTKEAHDELSQNPNWQDNFQRCNPTKASPKLPSCFSNFKMNFPRDYFATKIEIEIENCNNSKKIDGILQ